MIIWIVQYQKTRRGMTQARLFSRNHWNRAVRFANSLGTGKQQLYMKPIVFQATTRDN